ncbi:unnamed protein product, partial [Prorocentrum cordatum]
AAVGEWIAAHPRVQRERYELRRALLLEAAARDPRRRGVLQDRLDPRGTYQRARHAVALRRGVRRRPGAGADDEGAGGPAAGSRAQHSGGCAGAGPPSASTAASGRRPGVLFAGIHCIFQECSDAVSSLALSRESAALLAVGTRAGGILLLLTGAGRAPAASGPATTAGPVVGAPPRLSGHQGAVAQLDFSAGDRYLASGGADGIIRVWRTDGGDCVRELSAATAVSTVAFHPLNPSLLLYAAESRGLACVSVSAAGAARYLALGDVAAAAFHDAGTVAFAAAGGAVEVLQLHAERDWELSLWRSFPLEREGTAAAPPTPLGLTYTSWLREFGSAALLAACSDRAVRVFSWHGMASEREPAAGPSAWVDRILDAKGAGALCCRLVVRLPAAVRAAPGPAAFCGEGASHAVCGLADGSIAVVDLRTLRVAESLAAHGERVCALRAGASGGLLASGDAGGCVVVWGTTPAPQRQEGLAASALADAVLEIRSASGAAREVLAAALLDYGSVAE